MSVIKPVWRYYLNLLTCIAIFTTLSNQNLLFSNYKSIHDGRQSFISWLEAKVCPIDLPGGHIEKIGANSSYDEFPQWNIAIPQLEATGEYLASNNKAAAKLLSEELRSRTKRDPEFFSLSINANNDPEFKRMIPFCAPYDFNRLRSITLPQVYINASIIHTPEQEFVLAGCPFFREQVTELFMYLLKEWAPQRVWVSLHETAEKPNFCNDFWLPDFVKTLPLRDDWKLVKDSTVTLAEGSSLNAKGKKPALIQTTLKFSNGFDKKTIYHLHYDGWVDKTTCPDGALFMLLLEKMAELNNQGHPQYTSTHIPILINCMGGVGRSGMTAIGYMCYLKILACPKENRSQLTLNIPETIYALRKQRAGVCDNPEHIAAVHSFLGKYTHLS